MKDIVYRIALKSESAIIVRAAEIENGFWAPENVPQEVTLNLYPRERHPDDQGDPTNKHVQEPRPCTVLMVDPERMRDPYLVRLPNGNSKWVGPDSGCWPSN